MKDVLPKNHFYQLNFSNQTNDILLFKSPRIFNAGLTVLIATMFSVAYSYLFYYHFDDATKLFPGYMLLAGTIVGWILSAHMIFTDESLKIQKSTQSAVYTYKSFGKIYGWQRDSKDLKKIIMEIDTDNDGDKCWFFFLEANDGLKIPIYSGVSIIRKKHKDKALSFAMKISNFLDLEFVCKE